MQWVVSARSREASRPDLIPDFALEIKSLILPLLLTVLEHAACIKMKFFSIPLIELYEIMRGIFQLEARSLLPRVEQLRTRGHRIKVKVGKRFKRKPRGQLLHTKGGGHMEQAGRGGS